MGEELTRFNLESVKKDFRKSINEISGYLKEKEGLDFIISLKRNPIRKIFRYENISLYEAANRLATDCVILNAVTLLFERHPEISHFKVDFGSYNTQAHDIMGYSSIEKETLDKPSLLAEAFSASESLFDDKKRKTIKKMKASDKYPAEVRRLIVFNNCYMPDNQVGAIDSEIIHFPIEGKELL